MTNPTASNSGFVALVGVASALAQNGGALDQGNINVTALKDFFSGQALTAGSSGWLADSYVRSQSSLDGMVNYESVLLSLNQGNQLHGDYDNVVQRLVRRVGAVLPGAVLPGAVLPGAGPSGPQA